MKARPAETLRVGSFNLNWQTRCAVDLGALVAAQDVDLILLQEANPKALDRFCAAAGLDWHRSTHEVAPTLLRAMRRDRSHGAAIAGRGAELVEPTVFPGVTCPEKVLAGWRPGPTGPMAVVSYHAPAGVTHHIGKPRQAVHVANWLARLRSPAIMGGDFNTPVADPPCGDAVRTHWHSGHPKLGGEPGDDLLVGPEPVHPLRDALRLRLAASPDEMADIEASRPDGPLAVSYRTVNEYRYDAIWLSPEFDVVSVDYFYEESRAAGTDHGLVVADVVLPSLPIEALLDAASAHIRQPSEQSAALVAAGRNELGIADAWSSTTTDRRALTALFDSALADPDDPFSSFLEAPPVIAAIYQRRLPGGRSVARACVRELLKEPVAR